MTSFHKLEVSLLPASEASRGIHQFRRTRSRYGAITTKFGRIGYESSLEGQFVLMMAVDPQVRSIVHQPLRINFRTSRSNRARHYTPDYHVTRDRSCPWVWGFPKEGFGSDEIIEIKPHARSRLSDLTSQERHFAGKMWCEQTGLNFRILTESFISPAAAQNATGILAAGKLQLPEWVIGRPVLSEPVPLGEIVDSCVADADERLGTAILHLGASRGWFWFAYDIEVSLTTLVYPF